MADSIEALGSVSIQDVTFHTEITAGGPWHGFSVYFHDDEPETNGRD